jgi:cytochrome bd ubiquinol oxidase subunit I
MLVAFALLMYACLPSVVLAAFSKVVHRFRLWHLLLMAMVPLPYVAMTAGWIFREAGRQPWVIQGLLKTEDAASRLSAGEMRASLAVFGTLFALLITVNWWLLLRAARRGPGELPLGDDGRTDGGGGSGADDPSPAFGGEAPTAPTGAVPDPVWSL